MSDVFHERLQTRRSEQKRTHRFIFLGLLLGILMLAGYVVQSDVFQKKYVYPYPHQTIIARYAEKYRIENSLVAGVIMSESKFQNEVHSDRGAIGLMQLMPSTAKWIAEQLEDSYDMEKLHEPEMNIRFGTWYLSSLKKSLPAMKS